MVGKRITLADVAREAGVSVQTASHVMSGNMTVRLPIKTREHVKAAAALVGYRPNRLAQAMKRGKTHVIGVWLPLDRPVVSYLKFLRCLNDRALATGYDLMITGIPSQLAYSAEGRLPTQWPVDGLIALDAGQAVKAFREDVQNDSTPVVVLGLESYSNSDSVCWDVRAASYEATKALIERGAKRIVHVTPGWVLAGYPREQRRRGYTGAMEAAGLAVEFLAVPDESRASASEAVTNYVRERGVPDAFFAFSDTFAIAASRSLFDLGADVPGQCCIWGFGDYPEAEDHRVPISTIQLPIDEVIHQAWEWLLERIQDPSIAHRESNLPMTLVERESSRKT